MAQFSLSETTIRRILLDARPLGHHEDVDTLNLGFGFLYYGVVRAVRPGHVLVIGSGFGFSVVCLAMALRDNGRGRLTFVDPAYDVFREGPLKTMGGRGKWRDPQETISHFEGFGVKDLVTHHRLSSASFFDRFEDLGLPGIDLAFVDGNHALEHVRHDFLQVLRHAGRNRYVFLHDTHIYVREFLRHSGVRRWVDRLRACKDCFEVLDFPFSSGVALVRILKRDAWKHLEPLS